MSPTNCSFQNCFELLLLWLLRQDRIKIRTVLVATSLPSSGLSNDEEDSRGSRDRAAATSGVRGEEGGRGPRRLGDQDQGLHGRDDRRHQEYIETEHGLKLWKRNFWMSQEGKHIPYQDPVSSIDPKVPIMVHFN